MEETKSEAHYLYKSESMKCFHVNDFCRLLAQFKDEEFDVLNAGHRKII